MNSWLNESPGMHRSQRTTVVEIHPDDALAAGVSDGDLVSVASRTGRIELPARISDAMRRGVVCVPHGWGSRIFDPMGGETANAFGVNRNLLVDDLGHPWWSTIPLGSAFGG
jgi:formate dehydrogenase